MDYKRIAFQGYSMYPALRPGDTLILDIVAPAHCAPGDIICVPRKQELVVHRIIGVDRSVSPPVVVTKGDNLTYPDPPTAVPPAGIPRVILVSRSDGRLVRLRFGRVMAALSGWNLTTGIVSLTVTGAEWANFNVTMHNIGRIVIIQDTKMTGIVSRTDVLRSVQLLE